MDSRFDHEKLDAYRVGVEFVAWTSGLVAGLDGKDRYIRDQLARASQSIPLNIAEGNGKRAGRERRRFFEIARGSAMECAASLDILLAIGAVGPDDIEPGKQKLHRIVSMLTRLAPPDEQGSST